MHCLLSQVYCLKYLALLACVSPACSAPAPTRSEPATVDLGYVQYQGTTLAASGVNQFLGMRYAKPPLGDQRWRAPQDPEDQSGAGVQQASSFGPICIGVHQNSSSSSYSEDCLFISVFSPANATSTSKLPVWFFIQGGGYASNSNANVNGTEVVVRSGYNVIFVQLNYRVGALGFLASEKIRADGELNVGLLDQRKALQWVQKYIHLFGGDPGHVVIHGASAGAGSVVYHLAAYGGRNDSLFVGAMPESPFFPPSFTVEQSEYQFDRFVNATGCSGASDQLACLRGLDIATIQHGNVRLPFPGATGAPNFYFLPVVDGAFSQQQLYTQLSSGKFVQVPTLVGGDTNEGDSFVPDATSQAEVNTFLIDQFPHLTATNVSAIDAAYPPTPRLDHAAYFSQVSAAYGNSTFACGGLAISAAVSRHVGENYSWNYLYNVVSPSAAARGLGATHTVDLSYIFGSIADSEQTPLMMDYYLSFVRTLNPNTHKAPGAPSLGEFNSTEQNRLVINLPLNATGMETVSEGQKSGCELWTNLASATDQ